MGLVGRSKPPAPGITSRWSVPRRALFLLPPSTPAGRDPAVPRGTSSALRSAPAWTLTSWSGDLPGGFLMIYRQSSPLAGVEAIRENESGPCVATRRRSTVIPCAPPRCRLGGGHQAIVSSCLAHRALDMRAGLLNLARLARTVFGPVGRLVVIARRTFGPARRMGTGCGPFRHACSFRRGSSAARGPQNPSNLARSVSGKLESDERSTSGGARCRTRGYLLYVERAAIGRQRSRWALIIALASC